MGTINVNTNVVVHGGPSVSPCVSCAVASDVERDDGNNSNVPPSR